MTAPELTLQSVKTSAKPAENVYRVSDFLTKEQKVELAKAHEERAAVKTRGFDEIDAYSAEILGRFGFDAWQAWQCGQFKAEKMAKMVLAERARAKRELLGLEGLILAAVSGANRPTKRGHVPRSLKNAVKIFKSEQKQAKGIK